MYNGRRNSISSIAPTASVIVLRGTTVLPRHRGTIFLRYQYRRFYGTFWYRNTTSTAVLRHGTCPLLTHSNENLLDYIVFRLKLQPSACLLSFTAKLHTFHLLILCCFVAQCIPNVWNKFITSAAGVNHRPWRELIITTVLWSTAVFFHGTYRGVESVVPRNTSR